MATTASFNRFFMKGNSKNGSRTMISMPAVSGIRWGTLVASFDLTKLERSLEVTRWSIIGAAFLVFLVIVLTLYLVLAQLVVRPVRALAGAAERVHEGDLSARSDVLGTDELGQLAVDFNAMSVILLMAIPGATSTNSSPTCA